MKHEWSGDVDLGEGNLQEEHKYLQNLQFVEGIGLKERRELARVKQDLETVTLLLVQDSNFLQKGLLNARDVYRKKQKQHSVSEESLFALAWNIEEFEQLEKENRRLKCEATEIRERITDRMHVLNISGCLCRFRKSLNNYVKGVIMKKREAATHLMVFMVSDEKRNMKPYAVPVIMMLYKSLTDSKLQKLKEELVREMNSLDMVAVGFVTDGEFNYLRTKGASRPLSVIQLIMASKAEARGIHSNEIAQFLTAKQYGNDVPTIPLIHHPAVPLSDVKWLALFMENEEVGFNEAIRVLR
ncbi:uncharacterized protein [Ptychodera flava]|uniref:uncharacterized protein n=1 Tax=Ptychodera flava TaxID=63121 RepID=UPI00396AA7D2